MTAYQTARHIAANPQPHHGFDLRLRAWAVLKAAHGQTIRQTILRAQRTRFDSAVPANSANPAVADRAS